MCVSCRLSERLSDSATTGGQPGPFVRARRRGRRSHSVPNARGAAAASQRRPFVLTLAAQDTFLRPNYVNTKYVAHKQVAWGPWSERVGAQRRPQPASGAVFSRQRRAVVQVIVWSSSHALQLNAARIAERTVDDRRGAVSRKHHRRARGTTRVGVCVATERQRIRSKLSTTVCRDTCASRLSSTKSATKRCALLWSGRESDDSHRATGRLFDGRERTTRLARLAATSRADVAARASFCVRSLTSTTHSSTRPSWRLPITCTTTTPSRFVGAAPGPSSCPPPRWSVALCAARRSDASLLGLARRRRCVVVHMPRLVATAAFKVSAKTTTMMMMTKRNVITGIVRLQRARLCRVGGRVRRAHVCAVARAVRRAAGQRPRALSAPARQLRRSDERLCSLGAAHGDGPTRVRADAPTLTVGRDAAPLAAAAAGARRTTGVARRRAAQRAGARRTLQRVGGV